MKQIQYEKDATYIGTIHSECYKVLRISVIFYNRPLNSHASRMILTFSPPISRPKHKFSRLR